MQKVRFIATGLFYLTRILAIPYLATAVYALISIVFETPSFSLFDNGRRFVINYPFTDNRFLIGDEYSFAYIFEMIAFIGLYGVFFWLLSNIFQTFRDQKLFTPRGVRRLTIFYLFNFLTPLPFLIGHLIGSYEVGSVVVITLLHTVLGVFAYFMAVIFSRGLHLQNEQDLIF